MKLVINGKERDVTGVATIDDLLRALDLPPERTGIAVARNDAVVPRSRWRETNVGEGDVFEIITAVQGG